MARATKIFSKPLTETDIEKRMAIPSKILSSLPDFNGSHSVKIHLWYGTRMWPLVCSVRKKGYKKPVFSNGWRNFVICNGFKVGDELALYKVQDEAGSFHYRVELVEKPAARASGPLSPHALSLNHEVDESETTGTCGTKVCNFQHCQGTKLPEANASMKEEGATVGLDDIVADAPVPFLDHVIAKAPSRTFGTGVSDEATSITHFNAEMKFFGITMGIGMGEPPRHAYYITKEERDIKLKPIDLNDGGSLAAYGTSQAAGEAYYKSTEMFSLDLALGQPTPYDGAVNLDLTLAQPIVHI